MYKVQKCILVFLVVASGLMMNLFLTTDTFELPKLLALIIAVGVLTVINVVDIALDGISADFRVLKWNTVPKEFYFLILFFLAQIAAFIFSTDRSISLAGESERYQGFLTQIHYVLLALNTVYFFVRYPGRSNTIFNWLVGTLLVVSALAVSPYFLPMTFPFYYFTPAFFYDRVFSTLGNPNYLAAFIIGVLPFLVLWKPRTHTWKAVLWAGLALVLITLFLTGSRSAWVASLGGFVLLGILNVIRGRNYKVFAITMIIILGIGVTAGFKKYIAPAVPQVERLQLDTERSTSIQTRVYLWKAGWKMFKDRPLVGYGQDMIKDNIEPYLPEYLMSNNVFYIDRTHSEFTDILVTQGIFAFIGYVGFLFLVLWRSFGLFLGKGDAMAEALAATPHFLPAFVALATLIAFHAVNFSITSSNILLYLFAGYLMVPVVLGSRPKHTY